MTDQNKNKPGTIVTGRTLRRDEATNLIATGVHTGLRKGTDKESARRMWQAISAEDDLSWGEASMWAFEALRTMGYEIVKVDEVSVDADQPPLAFHCQECKRDSPSELARWQRYYTQGEMYVDTCAHCGAAYSMTISAVRNPSLDRQRV